jgi:hypothetical protein
VGGKGKKNLVVSSDGVVGVFGTNACIAQAYTFT